MLLGQWLATAEVVEVVIAPIVFSFIKPLCRCLTLGISCNDWCGVCSLLKLICCRLTLAVVFEMSWVQSIVLFFSYLAWTLYVVGLVVEPAAAAGTTGHCTEFISFLSNGLADFIKEFGRERT